MTTGSAAQNARDTAKDARESLREVRKAANEASGDIESDLKALRDDFGRLAEQIADIVAGKGQAAWRRARGSVDDVVDAAQDKGREAVDAVRDVSDTFVDAVDESIAKRPYTTLALVAAIGFVLGATWRR
ncbi:MAG TPA: hypothetical protein VL976_05095 [Xanthobacteraceae bacterium]|jgi:ElaB/YqjD/DUF883 family membrane-anchored ribosome-binding protein|nr:hypothetical protein [Xanthobacteraceae bacterium]